MTADVDLVSGRLTLAPGASPAIVCERPMVGAGLMRRLCEGRRAALMPDLVGSIFSLASVAQRGTSRRAVCAALALEPDPPPVRRAAALGLALATARDHLQRFALDLPTLLPVAGIDADPHGLRDAPVFALSAHADLHALEQTAAALPGWLERRLLGIAPAEWRRRWQADPAGWLAEWCERGAHPLAHWLAAVQPQARSIVLPCRPLALVEEGVAGLRTLVDALALDPDFPEHPLWHGAPAETGPWARAGRADAIDAVVGVWQRLGARLADLAALAEGAGLAHGAFELAPGEGVAFTEMSRGLLIHWVRLEEGSRRADTARVADYRVFSPTEWNFHPEGTFGQALAAGHLDTAGARLAALALDPCVRFDVREPQSA